MPWVAVLDGKHELTWRAFQTTRSLAPILASREPSKWIYRPDGPDDSARAIDGLFRMGGWTIAVDEVYSLTRRPNAGAYPEPYLRALTRGRSRGITVWSGMQRPRQAAWQAFTESTHFFVFQLTHSEDRKHVAQFTIPELADFRPPRYSFGYHERINQTFTPSGPLRKEVR